MQEEVLINKIIYLTNDAFRREFGRDLSRKVCDKIRFSYFAEPLKLGIYHGIIRALEEDKNFNSNPFIKSLRAWVDLAEIDDKPQKLREVLN